MTSRIGRRLAGTVVVLLFLAFAPPAQCVTNHPLTGPVLAAGKMVNGVTKAGTSAVTTVVKAPINLATAVGNAALGKKKR